MNPKKALAAIGTVLIVVTLSDATKCGAQTNISPAAYLASQPKPNFASGHQLPVLTRWLEGTLSSNVSVPLANDWGYALTLSGYATPTVASNVTIPGTYDYGMVQLAKNNTGKYKLSVLIDRTFWNLIPNGFWCTNSAGLFVDSYSNSWPQNTLLQNGVWVCSTNTTASGSSYQPVVSPEGLDTYWTNATACWIGSLQCIQSNIPIAVVLNGGEYGLNVLGFAQPAFQQDARVQAQAVMTNTWTPANTNGMSWSRYSSNRKAHQLGFLTAAIQQTLPARQLYIFYNTGAEQNRMSSSGNAYLNWGWSSDVMVTNTDLPSFEDYYANLGSWTNNPNDLLTKHLNAVGTNIALGHPLTYNWVCGGWGANAANLSDIPHYMGFLKCLYTAGMVGGIAGYFDYPTGGFDATFPSNSPPQWLLQMMALSQVHALFSQLEGFLYNGDLLPGPNRHAMSQDQPAYEFTNPAADPTARVLARKLRARNTWLITAWAASGTNRNVTVTIPSLGAVQVLARDSGAVYIATTNNLALQDTDGLLPTGTPDSPSNLHVVP